MTFYPFVMLHYIKSHDLEITLQCVLFSSAGADPGFPVGGAPTLVGGGANP